MVVVTCGHRNPMMSFCLIRLMNCRYWIPKTNHYWNRMTNSLRVCNFRSISVGLVSFRGLGPNMCLNGPAADCFEGHGNYPTSALGWAGNL
jgi:hypothetical protein